MFGLFKLFQRKEKEKGDIYGYIDLDDKTKSILNKSIDYSEEISPMELVSLWNFIKKDSVRFNPTKADLFEFFNKDINEYENNGGIISFMFVRDGKSIKLRINRSGPFIYIGSFTFYENPIDNTVYILSNLKSESLRIKVKVSVSANNGETKRSYIPEGSSFNYYIRDDLMSMNLDEFDDDEGFFELLDATRNITRNFSNESMEPISLINLKDEETSDGNLGIIDDSDIEEMVGKTNYEEVGSYDDEIPNIKNIVDNKENNFDIDSDTSY